MVSNCFDGYRFAQFFFDKTDTTTIVSNDVVCLLEDSKQRLWVGCNQGLCRYDYESNAFVRYPFPSQLNPRVQCLEEDNHGNIIVGTAGRSIFAIREGSDRPYPTEKQLSQGNPTKGYFTSVFSDDQHMVWLGHQTSVITRMKMSQLNPTSVKDFESPYGPVVKFIKTGNNGFLAVCMYGILRYDYATSQFSDAGYDLGILQNNISIRWAQMSSDGNIYLGTSGKGLCYISKGSKTLQQVDDGGRFGLFTANVNHMFEDKDHNLWVSCYKKGLVELNQVSRAFTPGSLPNRTTCWEAACRAWPPTADGGVWCTVQKSGIYHFDSNGHITTLGHLVTSRCQLHLPRQAGQLLGGQREHPLQLQSRDGCKHTSAQGRRLGHQLYGR